MPDYALKLKFWQIIESMGYADQHAEWIKQLHAHVNAVMRQENATIWAPKSVKVKSESDYLIIRGIKDMRTG